MSNPTCYPKTALKHYMAGWTDAEESSVIEAHISECIVCEQTLAELEGEPETLVEFLQGNSKSSDHSQASDPLVGYALSKAKQLGSDHTAPTNDPASTVEKPPAAIGPYDLLRPIGQGSMGRVYLARHRQLGKLVAIKILASRAFRSDQYAARFEREIRAAGALQHPSIINATDAGQVDSVHYLVMEYIEGLDLSRLARAVSTLSIQDVCAIGQAMALGLDHAHAAGIVHRDIKPSNVMLSTSGQVKLLDFGLAQTTLWDEASAELTTVGQLMGTIDYMAPEQAERAESVDYRADLYALGATLFRLLCGRAPLAASPNLSPLARLRLLATSSPPALRTLRPDAPLELEKLIHQLLSRDPEARPASAAHVAEQLAQWSDGANLPALIRTAQQATPVSPHESITADELYPAVSLRSTQPPHRFGRWLMAAAAGAFALAAVVLITLETQKGQIVIESIDANVTVQLSKDGQVQKSLTVVPGATSTRIAAGQYDVSIAAGSDQFAMDRETLEIKRGETVVARVRQLPQASSLTPSTVSIAPAIQEDVDATVYEGKTLATWRKELIRDRSLEAIQGALEAINALANEQERPALLQEFMQNFPTHLEQKERGEVMHMALGVARDSQTHTQCVLAVLSKVDDDKARMLLNLGTQVLYRLKQTDRKAWLDSLAQFAQWSSSFLQDENQRPKSNSRARELLCESAGLCIVSYLNELQAETPRPTQRQRVFVELLKSSKVLGEQFWSRIIPEIEQPLPEAMAAAVEERATSIFLESQDPVYVCQATLQLIRFNNKIYNRNGMPPLERRAEIVEKIRVRLREFIDHPESTMQFVRISNDLYPLLNRPQVSTKLMRRVLTVDINDTQTNPGIDLLGLAANLNASSELDDELADMLARVKEPSIRLASQFVGVTGQSIRIGLPLATRVVDGISSDLNLGSQLPSIQIAAEEVLPAFIFSQIEGMLPNEKRSALTKELREAIKQRWLDQQMKTYDLNADGKLDANELPNPKAADGNEDHAIDRKELEAFYYFVMDGIENRKQRKP